jgi:hypothetical protein
MHNFNLRLLRAGFTKALENKLVFASLANSTFSGEINQKNDTVKLIQLGDIDIGDYVDGTDITNQSLTDAQLELIADQDKYFSYTLDTLEYNNAKSGILNEAARKAAYAANSNVDTFFAAKYAQAGLVNNTNASPVDLTSLNVEDEFLEMAEKFADAGVPRETRKVAIIPPWVSTKLELAGITSKTNNDEIYARGYVATALGWDFVESNNVSKNSSSWDKTRIMCVVPGQSLGYASAVTDLETTSVEKQIGKTLVKGRFVYGGRVVRPDMTGVIYADKTAEA